MRDLHDKENAVEFYETRYEEGYMEEWDESKKRKVREILTDLPLPSEGKALDFGCGNGVFTAILKECLPQWEIYGVEISKIAVANARKKYKDCNFFLADEAKDYKNQFDFIFSHHVIEHVPYLNETFQIINDYLKERSFQLHILPCANQGSFEHNIVSLKKNGIEVESENRFFYEESGHLRRLTSKEFEQWENKIGFRLDKEYYANQYSGVVNWITKSSPRSVKKLTSGSNAINEEAKEELRSIRKHLLPLTYLQFPYSKYWFIKAKWKKRAFDYLKLAILSTPSIASKKIYNRIEKKSEEEWDKKKYERNGSEMFLFFKR